MMSMNTNPWLPTSKKEFDALGWNELDVIIFTGDAYVDHPSFGAAVIGRVLEHMGLRVAIVPQPNWRDDLRDFRKLGAPRLFFGVTSGSMDSMVNHYTANCRLRSNDAYSPGGESGFRPDYAVTVYSTILKKLFPDVPLIIGGIEASLRRFTHYDYWSDSLKPGILHDTGADLLVYGMGEKPVREIARLLDKGVPIDSIKNIPQTAYSAESADDIPAVAELQSKMLYSHDECLEDRNRFAENFVIIEKESNRLDAARLIQKTGDSYIVVNPPFGPLSEKEMDDIYDLPFTRIPHPRYLKKGAIPAYEMIRHSITIHRGCFGGCSFCTISAHQGRHVSSRSEKSIMREVDAVTRMADFTGHITDLGGPTANMYRMHGIDMNTCRDCARPSCISPGHCRNLKSDIKPLLSLYRKVRNHPLVKKAAIGSGIRYDMLFSKDEKILGDSLVYVNELIKHHISGRLKVAPEHASSAVLKLMRKPPFNLFIRFMELFEEINIKENLRQQIIPYFISGHPGSTMEAMAEITIETRDLNLKLEQVQNFTPTPMTLATAMFYTGLDPYTMKKIFIPRKDDDRKIQHAFFFWRKPEHRKTIISALNRIGRKDLADRMFRK